MFKKKVVLHEKATPPYFGNGKDREEFVDICFESLEQERFEYLEEQLNAPKINSECYGMCIFVGNISS